MNWDHLYTTEESLTLPVMLSAKVVHGFKRGSKELGIPTANLDMDELGVSGESLNRGIYYGWAKLGSSIHKAVVSVGWNPYYKNEKKAIEAHLLTKDMADFYDEKLSVLLCGYLRDEANFNGLEELISCIGEDIRRTNGRLEEAAAAALEATTVWP